MRWIELDKMNSSLEDTASIADICRNHDLLKGYVSKRWASAASLCETLDVTVSELERVIIRPGIPSMPSMSDLVCKSLESIFSRLLREWSSAYNGYTSEILTPMALGSLIDPFAGIALTTPSNELNLRVLTPKEFVAKQIERIDFVAIVAFLEAKKSELEQVGLRETANKAKRIFFPEGITAPAMKGRNYEIKLSITHCHGSYRTSDVKDLEILYKALQVIGLESDAPTLADDVYQIYSIYESSGYENRIPYRTVINPDGAISGYVYKDSVGIRMRQDYFEIIVSFIKRYQN